MVDSGIKTDPEFVELFTNKMSQKKTQEFDYLICKLGKKNDTQKDNMVILDDSLPKGAAVEEYGKEVNGVPAVWCALVKRLKEEKDARYALAYLDYTTKDNRATDKLIFIYWCPETCKTKDKMIYSSTKLSFEKKLKTSVFIIQASEESDIEYKEVLESLL